MYLFRGKKLLTLTFLTKEIKGKVVQDSVPITLDRKNITVREILNLVSLNDNNGWKAIPSKDGSNKIHLLSHMR